MSINPIIIALSQYQQIENLAVLEKAMGIEPPMAKDAKTQIVPEVSRTIEDIIQACSIKVLGAEKLMFHSRKTLENALGGLCLLAAKASHTSEKLLRAIRKVEETLKGSALDTNISLAICLARNADLFDLQGQARTDYIIAGEKWYISLSTWADDAEIHANARRETRFIEKGMCAFTQAIEATINRNLSSSERQEYIASQLIDYLRCYYHQYSARIDMVQDPYKPWEEVISSEKISTQDMIRDWLLERAPKNEKEQIYYVVKGMEEFQQIWDEHDGRISPEDMIQKITVWDSTRSTTPYERPNGNFLEGQIEELACQYALTEEQKQLLMDKIFGAIHHLREKEEIEGKVFDWAGIISHMQRLYEDAMLMQLQNDAKYQYVLAGVEWYYKIAIDVERELCYRKKIAEGIALYQKKYEATQDIEQTNIAMTKWRCEYLK